jgi:Spx/MgsR family transcriptional regulator
MPITIYGIKACDTMHKARAWLDGHDIAYAFHDYKTQGVTRERLAAWAQAVGWETLLNRAGTTFRKLPDEDKRDLTDSRDGIGARGPQTRQPTVILLA